MQCCLEPQRQHYIRFFPWNFFPVQEILLGQYWTDKNPVQCCTRGSKQNCTSKNLSNVVREALHKNVQENFLFNIALKLFGQQCTGQNSMLCYLLTEEQILFSVVLMLLGQHSAGQNPMPCCLRCFRQHSIRKKSCAMFS